jgi:hypothetical protein
MENLIQILTILLFLSLGELPDTQLPEIGKISLEAKQALLFGEQLQQIGPDGIISGLAKPSDAILWRSSVEKPGWYQIVVRYSLKDDGDQNQASFNAIVGDQNRLGPIHATGRSDRFLPQVLFDPIELPKGAIELKLQVQRASALSGLMIQGVDLIKAREPGIP